jgi:hypothetical protein
MSTIIYLNPDQKKTPSRHERTRIASTIRASLSYLLPDAESAGFQATSQAIALALHGLEVDLQAPADRNT